MNTSETAAKLDTTPRVLRRFLRSDPTYLNAGSGGRYDFSLSDIPTLKKRFVAWSEKNSSRPRVSAGVESTPRRAVKSDSSADRVSIREAMSNNPRTRAAIRQAAEARVDRLEEMLRASGHHISQPGVAKINKVDV